MPSYYKANATLTARVENSTPTSYNAVTGDPIFSSTTVSMDVSIEPETNPNYGAFPGVEQNSLYLVGRLINPTRMPAEFIPNREYDINYYSVGGQSIIGKFYLLPMGVGRLGLEFMFGDAIAGYLNT